MNKQKRDICVAYNGVCQICGSRDGMIIKGEDNRHRVMCRVWGCLAHYMLAPADGYDSIEEAQDMDKGYKALTKNGPLTYGQYLGIPRNGE